MLKDESPLAARSTVGALDRGFIASCAVLLVAVACSIVVIAAPRPVQPSRLPALRVPLSEAKRAFASTPPSANTPLPQGRAMQRWLELYREEGLNEREAHVNLAMVAEQRAELRQLGSQEFPKLGPQGVLALMNALTDRALAALHVRRPTAEGYGLLGAFPELLAQYGYIDARHRALAPLRVIRVLYQQRFNMICERPLDTDIPPEDRALAEGWNALHGANIPPARRALAARAFAALGGIDSQEALAIWLFHGGLRDEAEAILEREYQRTQALRLRNMLLFVRRS
ncbi:MAG TPA: hypothetical protein VI299_15135 [Polyangiales bacterium]